MKTPLSALAGAIVVVLGSSWLLPSTAAGEDLEARVRALVLKHHEHGMPYVEVHALGPAAVPVLEHLLANDAHKAHWTNIVVAVGFIGDPRGYPILHDFIWKRFQGEVNLETFQSLIAAQGIVGHIAAYDAPKALAELERGVDPAAWDGLPWRYRDYRGSRLSLLWSKLTINALSYTGKPSARTVLERLRTKPYSEKQRSNIEEGLIRHAAVARVGIDAFQRAATTENP